MFNCNSFLLPNNMNLNLSDNTVQLQIIGKKLN